MNNITMNEITHYLTHCFHTSKQIARTLATDCYEKYDLHLLTPEDRNAELKRLAEIHKKEAEALDRQIYLDHADDAHFLLTYFTTGHNFFSSIEEEKYLQALIITEMNKMNQHHRTLTDIQIELQEMEVRYAEARSARRQPDMHEVKRMNYLLARFQLLQDQNVFEPQDSSKPKVARGPKRKYSFGYHGPEELLYHIGDDLNAEIGFLRLPTTTAHFAKVATAEDLSIVEIPVHMGCQNTQLIYVMEYFNTLFYSFNPATIGNSGLFYSKNGNLFNSHNLNSTSLDHVHKRYAIDAIFKKYGIAKA